jgi:His/Glu/Gln/Arg/opine family amino acid ABC transporter permease subunit
MQRFLTDFVPTYLPGLLAGAVVTLWLSFASMAAGLLIGLSVALGRLSRFRALRWPLDAYVEVWRDVPLIVQLLVIYFTLPQLGVSLPAFWAAVVGLSLNLGAYISEVFRAAILSIDNGQTIAGRSMGMSQMQIYRHIVLPQAFVVSLPTLGGYFIALLKDSSLVSFISVNELLRHGTIIISSTFQSMQTYFLVAIVYFVMSFVASRLVRALEHSMSFESRHKRWSGAHAGGDTAVMTDTKALP